MYNPTLQTLSWEFLGSAGKEGSQEGLLPGPCPWLPSFLLDPACLCAPGVVSCLTSISAPWMERECPERLSLSWPPICLMYSHTTHV